MNRIRSLLLLGACGAASPFAPSITMARIGQNTAAALQKHEPAAQSFVDAHIITTCSRHTTYLAAAP